MKIKIVFITAICCLSLQAAAQTPAEREYISLLNPENQWNQILQSTFGDFAMTYVTKLGSDTIINDTSYYKLLTTKDSLASIWLDDGYIREDVQNRKVYYRLGDSLEILLYDFSANVGDTIRTYDFQSFGGDAIIVVQDINEVLIGGKLRKKINLLSIPLISEYEPDYYYHTWIEGVGDIDGLLRSTQTYYIINSRPEWLLCFVQNEELIYKSDRFGITDCFVWYDRNFGIDVEESVNNSDISVFPNPLENLLFFTSLNQAISRVEIFNISGHKVYSQSHGNTIDVSSFSKGMYLLKVYDNNRQVSTFKIIKK